MNKKTKKAPVYQSGMIDVNKTIFKPPQVDLLVLWSSLTVLEDTIRETKIKITEWISKRT